MTGSHFTPDAWDCNPEPDQPELVKSKSFSLEFDCGGSFKWHGKASTLAAAEAKARAMLAGQFHTFNPQAAVLVTMERTS